MKDTLLPLEPHPVFLGITLDPKLNFKKHLESIENKIASRINLFRKVKSLKINQTKINSILFKSLIRSIFDYAFIILSCPTQRIMGNLQRIQNRILRIIKYFPPRTRIADIHAHFRIMTLSERSDQLLKKFTLAKQDHDLISSELEEFEDEIFPKNRRLDTTFDKMLRINASL